MNFSALMTLQRYARIDLGIVDLPWKPIRARTLEWMASTPTRVRPRLAGAGQAKRATMSRSAASTTGWGERGPFVYIKSSLTGDENDYIRDYARRNDTLPHETTGDQFFSEEQFEVFPALGFRIEPRFSHRGCRRARSNVVNIPGERCAKPNLCDGAR